MFGLQCWVALPQAHEETEPAFVHWAAERLPVEDAEGVTARIVAGELFGRRSPVETLSPLFFADVALQSGARLALPPAYPEQAIYIVAGRLDLGPDGAFDAGQLLVLKPGAAVTLHNPGVAPARLMLLGGEPLDGPRRLAWNFVSSSIDRIEQAKDDWRTGRFPAVPGETEFIPLPDPPAPVRYP